MPDGPITRAELWHATERVERYVDQLGARLEHRLDTMQFVSLDRYEALEKRVSEREDRDKWQARGLMLAVLTSVLLPLLTAWVLAR